MSEIRICKYCGMELLEDVPHGLRNCHLHAVARIAELEEKQRWIPVSERLPENRATVLAAFENREILTATYYKHHEGFGGVENYWHIEGWHSGNVTHWMPLPPNPESPNDTQTQTIVYGKDVSRSVK